MSGYDYTKPGAYFVTIVSQDRFCLFGEIVERVMRPNAAGRMVQAVWDAIPTQYPGVATDAFILMPNHVHAVIVLVGAAPRGRPCVDTPASAAPRGRPNDRDPGTDQGQARGPAPTDIGPPSVTTGGLSLADVVHRFKSMTTKRYADGVRRQGWPAFRGRLWHRNYYEHIVRDGAALDRIRRYIADNPARWSTDRENPLPPTRFRG